MDRVTWPVYDLKDPTKVIGTRTQLPLKLAWAMTVHKAQRKTLSAVEVYCRKEFAPGYLYVAFSRVGSRGQLPVVGFNSKRLIPAPKVVLDFFKNLRNVPAEDDCSCCRTKAQTLDICSLGTEDYDEEFVEDDLQEIDEAVSSYLATKVSEAETDTVNLAEVLEKLSSMENFQSIPEEFNTAEFVTSLTKTEEVTEVSRSLHKTVNDILSYLSQPETLPQTRLFLGAQWSRIFTGVRKQVSADVNTKVQRKEFTCHFADLHSRLFSNELKKEFAELVGIPVHLLFEQHYHVLT